MRTEYQQWLDDLSGARARRIRRNMILWFCQGAIAALLLTVAFYAYLYWRFS